MRFTMMATDPTTNRVEMIEVDAPDAESARQLIEFDGLEVREIRAAPSEPPVATTPSPVETLALKRAGRVSRNTTILVFGTAGISVLLPLLLPHGLETIGGLLMVCVFLIPQAAVLLYLAHKTHQLHLWAAITLLVLTPLTTAFFGRTALGLVMSERIAHYILAFSLLFTIWIIIDCARLIPLLGRIQRDNAKGFAVEPIDAGGVATVSTAEAAAGHRGAGRSSENRDSAPG